MDFFFKFRIHIVIGNEWYGIVDGQSPFIFNRVTAFVHNGINSVWPIIPLLFIFQ